MVQNPQAPYEYVRIEGRRALVCATTTCRLPLEIGKAVMPIYPVPEVGDPHPYKKQAVCGPCFRAQYAMVYPGMPVPDVPDALIPGGKPVIKELIDEVAAEVLDDDYALWERAIEQSKGSAGAETVAMAYKRLLNEPDIDLGAPPEVVAVTRE